MLSVTVPPGPAVTPRTVAMASGTAAGSLIVASSTTQTPSGNSWVSSAATCTESRVLPTPPTPVRVTSRCASHELADLLHLHLAADEARDLHRQVARGGVQRPQRRERGLEAVRPHLVEADRRRQVPQPVLAEIDQVDPGDQRGR